VISLHDALHAYGLRQVSGRAVRIAVVDSGVYAAHPHVHGVAGGVSLMAGAPEDDYLDRNGHGTAVAAAIREKAPAAELIAVKVFDRELATTATQLSRAIEWAAGQRVDLINLSVGTTNPAHAARLAQALAVAHAAGAAVVAAAMQSGLPSLPGSLQPVIAVDVDWDCARDEVLVDGVAPSVLRVRASGYPRPIPGVPPERNLKGVSFAVANATGAIARFLRPAASA
jgi:subtilisin family serine protease